ncbi:hypothetical protein [Pedobacter jeongneungensis]|uniref:hypothetical protein n=1 Tax=Pedobacter jeongneungensis TaxID=947309 RepID=UPI0004681D1E|nr:hypothetical protein [Pedobacter jeongneungensis]
METNRIEKAIDFLTKKISYRTLMIKRYSANAKTIYYGGLVVVALILAAAMFCCWYYKNFYSTSLLFLLSIIYFTRKKSGKENFKVLNEDSRHLNFQIQNNVYHKDDFSRLQHKLFEKYCNKCKISIDIYNIIEADFISNYSTDKYDWKCTKIIGWLAVFIISGCLIPRLTQDLKPSSVAWLSLFAEVSCYLIVLIPFMEFNIFKLSHDNTRNKNIYLKRFLQEFKIEYFKEG